MQRAITIPALAAVAALAGCSDRRPKYVYQTQPAAVTTAGTPQTPGMTPAGGAPVSSGSVANPGSGSVAPPTTTTSPGPVVGPGGLHHPPSAPLPAATTTITVGEGPVVGRTVRGDVREDMRDWEDRDLRLLDPRDARLAGDGLRDSRELVAFYCRRQAGDLLLRLDLLDLAYGAELGGLDVVVLIGWGGGGGHTALPLGLRETTAHSWRAALVVRDAQDATLLDAPGSVAVPSGSPALEVAFRSDLDGLELSVDAAELQALGWGGQDLRFQVLTVKDGDDRVADAALEVDLLDRRLDAVVREGWTAERRGVVSMVLVGNRAALSGSDLADLVHSTATTTGEGHPTGLRRTVESHTAHGLPVNVHLSGVLANAIGWAGTGDPLQDGDAFLGRVSALWDGDPATGEGAFLPGLYVDNMLPYFEGAANDRFRELAAEVYRERLGVAQPGPVFWTPERVIGGAGFAEIAAAGFTHTVIDRSHLRGWFGAPVTDGKLHRVNGVDCFVVDPTVSPFRESDGGAQLELRRLLLERALDPDPEQAVVLVADWEQYAGHKGDPNVPDSYDRVLRWLGQRPWIEVATLEDLAGRGWGAIDHGVDPTLAVEAHEWLRHACEEDYDHWYYGHPLEQSFAAFRSEVRPGVPQPRALGDVHTPGTLMGDLWAGIQAAPQGALRDLAAATFASKLYRTAWHQEDMHDTTLLGPNAYLRPDTTPDDLSGFVVALVSHMGEVGHTVEAARWAASPPAQPTVARVDTDLDGEEEHLLMDDRLLLVCERDGGRVVAGYARDPQTGEGYQVLGGTMAFPERSTDASWEDPTIQAPRASALKDVWLTGPGRDYVNDATVASVSTTSTAVTFTSSDGKLAKTIAWRAPGEVEVTYALDPGAGTLYTRAGLCPDLGALAIGGQAGLAETDDGRTYELANTRAGRTVFVRVGYADAGHTARRNPQASDGTAASPRNAAFQHLIELSGDAPGFAFSLSAGVR